MTSQDFLPTSVSLSMNLPQPSSLLRPKVLWEASMCQSEGAMLCCAGHEKLECRSKGECISGYFPERVLRTDITSVYLV